MSAQPKTLTEAAIQDLLYFHCISKGHILVNPNSCVYGWESDFVSITRNLMAHEYEIKISKSDFKADAQKERHKLITSSTKIIYADLPKYRREVPVQRPNFFYYVCPEHVAAIQDVPDYAGLIHVVPFGHRWILQIIKRTRKLHDEPIDQKRLMQLARSVMFRYWRQRLR